MANSVGQLLVELGVNSAAFIDGMDKATYKAKQAAKEIGDAFEGMGNSIEKLFAPFGELGARFGETFSGIADTLKSVAGELGGMGSAAGAAAVGLTALVAAGVAIEGAFIGLAMHSAENAGELQKMSLQTGVAVEQLSRLAFAANTVGIGQEAIVRSLQMMSRQALSAATGTGRMNDAFSRLHINVKDSNGELKNAGDLFNEVAGKVAGLNNETEKVAVMRQLFGRAGASMLPLVENMGELTTRAKELGFEIDGKTAKAAEKFEMDLRVLGQAATGVGNQLLSTLLPIFQQVSDYMIEGLKDVISWTKEHAETIKVVAQYMLSFGGIVFMVIKDVIDLFVDAVKGVWHFGEALANIAISAAHLDWSGMKKGAYDAVHNIGATTKEEINDLKGNWDSYGKFVNKVFGATNITPGKNEKGGGTNKLDLTAKGGAAGAKETDMVAALVTKLQEQAKAELALASAAEISTAALILKKGAVEGEKAVSDLRNALKQKELQLVDQIAAANKEGNSKAAAALEQRLKFVATELENLQTKGPEIVRLHEEIAAGGFAGKAVAESNKATEALQQQAKDLDALSAAYQKGGNAVEAAQLDVKLKKENETISTLNEMLMRLRNEYGETDPAVQALEKTLEHENAQLAAQKFLLDAISYKDLVVQIDKLNQSYSQMSDNQRMLAVAQEIAKFDLNKQYDDQIKKLEDTRAVMAQLGMSTLQVDAAIYDAQQKLNKQWDEAAIKMGGFKDKVGGVLDEVRMEGDNMWASIADAGKTALDGLTNALAKFVVTGKGSFKQVAQGFEESVVQSIFKKTESNIAGGIEKMFGLGPGTLGGSKPDGSSESAALWVQIAGQGGAGAFGASGLDNLPLGNLGGIAKLLFPSGGEGSDEGGGGVGGFFSSLFSSIGSIFRETGGPVLGGHAYIVGERRPELFVPHTNGKILPSVPGSNGSVTNLSVNFHGVTDHDSFKKNQTQVMAQIHRATAMAMSRNGG
jgi:phage-related protein